MKLYIDTSSSEKIFIKLDGESFEHDAREDRAQALLPFIDQTLKAKNKTVKDLTEIEVFLGPGSFTGLRVGVSVAQALAWSLGIPLNGKEAGQSLDINYN